MSIGIDGDEIEEFFLSELINVCSTFIKNDDELLACINGFASGANHINYNIKEAIPNRSIDIILNGLPEIQAKRNILYNRFSNPNLIKDIIKSGRRNLEEL